MAARAEGAPKVMPRAAARAIASAATDMGERAKEYLRMSLPRRSGWGVVRVRSGPRNRCGEGTMSAPDWADRI
ncbi:hypothetical protein GCM10018783_19530 [Streptomyces griseosporeus]|nr:hypothetical protein GCM10018783_19530 [Streptomyces griseosporeus]